MENFKWTLVEAIEHLTDHRQEEAKTIWDSLRESFQKDEYAIALGPALREIESKAAKLLADTARTQPGTGQSPRKEEGTTAALSTPKVPGARLLAGDSRTGLSADEVEKLFSEIRQKLKDNPAARLNVTWEVYEP